MEDCWVWKGSIFPGSGRNSGCWQTVWLLDWCPFCLVCKRSTLCVFLNVSTRTKVTFLHLWNKASGWYSFIRLIWVISSKNGRSLSYWPCQLKLQCCTKSFKTTEIQHLTLCKSVVVVVVEFYNYVFLMHPPVRVHLGLEPLSHGGSSTSLQGVTLNSASPLTLEPNFPSLIIALWPCVPSFKFTRLMVVVNRRCQGG